MVGTLIWHAIFPHTFWFTRLWTGFATGMPVAMLPGTFWELRAAKRRSVVSGEFIVTGALFWGLFACISLFLVAPDLAMQEHERAKIRSLTIADISAISVRSDGRRT